MALKVVNFGSAKGGLATVGYAIYGVDGAVITSRATTGVVEIGTSTGIYAAPITLPDYDSIILWDTGEATPKYSTEDYQYQLQDIINSVLPIQKIYNSIKNQGDFMAALMDKLGLLEKNEGLKRVEGKIDALATKEGVSLNNIETAFERAAGSIKIPTPEVKIDNGNLLSEVSAQMASLREELTRMQSPKKDYTGNFATLIEMLRVTQRSIDKSFGDKAGAISKEISSLKTAFSRFDDLLVKIAALEKGVDKAIDKKEIMEAIRSLNDFIKRLGMTQQDMSILQAFGHKR